MQKVTVMGWAEQRKVLKAVRKTGRRAELWPYPYNPESYNFNRRQHETETFTYYANKPASSYNYNTHGYSEEEFGYYQKPAYAAIVDEEASAIFSDENPHACSVM
ncbi:HEAVY METAL-ASSOCIATED ISOPRENYLATED PLANT PROTEIN 28 [Salix viminalis]|uniref:HEAVY METAL-ASSOCIATED ISOPRENYLATED PLANT PROTEIN 28 n=1 Tax=Salix viminalis TaxID=40686 RepID=A0A9Q0TB51_SALVM|nr:HEAVY METAL-ASSOCIATED ISOPRENYLATED PLANT PROTEIN 28 [Salix viminalis]